MQVREYNKKAINKKPKSEVKEIIEKMKKEDERLVKGQFEFSDAEGGFFEFNYKYYPGEPIQTFELIHGEICEIPYGVVRHLNNTKRKIRRYKDVEQTPRGPKKLPTTFETTSRVKFIPQDYL